MVLILLVFTIVDLCPLTLLARDLYLNIKEGHLFMALAWCKTLESIVMGVAFLYWPVEIEAFYHFVNVFFFASFTT